MLLIFDDKVTSLIYLIDSLLDCHFNLFRLDLKIEFTFNLRFSKVIYMNMLYNLINKHFDKIIY